MSLFKLKGRHILEKKLYPKRKFIWFCWTIFVVCSVKICTLKVCVSDRSSKRF